MLKENTNICDFCSHCLVPQDYYDLLGVSRNAEKSEIKSGMISSSKFIYALIRLTASALSQVTFHWNSTWIQLTLHPTSMLSNGQPVVLISHHGLVQLILW